MTKSDYYGICQAKLKYLNYADSTCQTYLHYIQEFLISVEIEPSRLTSKDFQNYLDNYIFKSISQQNQIINAIRFLYKYGLERKYDKVSFVRPRKERRLPQPIAKDILIERISKIKNLKHKTILSLAFSVGLRVSEVVNLKLEHIDSDRMMIFIEKGKGKKDRFVPLSKNVLALLKQYFKAYKPKVYLFNGQKSLKYSASSCNKLVKNYIGKQYHFHQLRHSSFTSMMESGTDTRIIQKIAGHQSIKTTQVYTHVSNFSMRSVQVPI